MSVVGDGLLYLLLSGCRDTMPGSTRQLLSLVGLRLRPRHGYYLDELTVHELTFRRPTVECSQGWVFSRSRLVGGFETQRSAAIAGWSRATVALSLEEHHFPS